MYDQLFGFASVDALIGRAVADDVLDFAPEQATRFVDLVEGELCHQHHGYGTVAQGSRLRVKDADNDRRSIRFTWNACSGRIVFTSRP